MTEVGKGFSAFSRTNKVRMNGEQIVKQVLNEWNVDPEYTLLMEGKAIRLTIVGDGSSQAKEIAGRLEAISTHDLNLTRDDQIIYFTAPDGLRYSLVVNAKY